jgi:hypothetical protein
MVGEDEAAVDQLVRAGLWERSDDGFQIHDFDHYNLTREQVHQRLRKDSERKRNGGGTESEKKPGSSSGSSRTNNGKKNGSAFDSWLRHYRETTDHSDVRGSKAARAQFAARLGEGFSVDELKLATEGCHGDEFCRTHGHDVPETILRASKVQRYVNLGRKGKRGRRERLPGEGN